MELEGIELFFPVEAVAEKWAVRALDDFWGLACHGRVSPS